MTVVYVDVGFPAPSVKTDVEYDSHEGSSCVGAAMQGGANLGGGEGSVNRG
jgi:hypothetical protein